MEDHSRRSISQRGIRRFRLWTLCTLVSIGLAWGTTSAQPPLDTDHDGIADVSDNCIDVSNPAQVDTDCDGYGNRCDADYNNNGSVDGADFAVQRGLFGLWAGDPGYDANADHDSDGTIGGGDFVVFRQLFGAAPGPSGIAPLRAFPGAEGFGAFALGGRCGQVLKVTNLNDAGPGSLRWALEDVDAPRTVVFDTGGIIDLESSIDIDSRYVTIAGQTAPGGGITLRGARIRVAASDVIVRGLRIRPGDGPGAPGDLRDAISIGTPNATVERVIVDHCSFTWATDENAATYYAVRDVTFSNNLIAEGLRNSIHPKGAHSTGLFIGGDSKRVSILKNLLAHNMARNPLIKQGLSIEIINNYVYNYRSDGVQIDAGSSPSKVHVIGNQYVAGVDTIDRPPVYLSSVSSDSHLRGNIGIGRPIDSGPEEAIAHGVGLASVEADPIFVSSGVVVLDVEEVEVHVTSGAGAMWPMRDLVDERIVSESVFGTGSAIDSPSDRGGYSTVPAGVPPADPDGDGMPTWFEFEAGFDPSTPDANDDLDGDGYTNLEEYINAIVSGFASGGS